MDPANSREDHHHIADKKEKELIEATIGQVSGGNDLSVDQMACAINAIMQGKCQQNEIAMLLTALRAKGEAVTEVAGAALAMRQNMKRIHTDRDHVIDTCGTGGDGSNTFNISTAAAIVAAAAGANVAKHGNRAITSKTGSADVLRALGINVEASVDEVETCLNKLGICFCFAPLFHDSMRHVAAVRKKLGVPTIFNMLGPLCNPVEAPHQLLGVGKPELKRLLANALRLLGSERSIVVCGSDGLDEVTTTGETHVIKVEGNRLDEFSWSPTDFGVSISTKETMVVDGPEASAKMIREVLQGAPGPRRDIVILNAAAALWTTQNDSSAQECAKRAEQAIDSGAARDLLARLAELIPNPIARA